MKMSPYLLVKVFVEHDLNVYPNGLAKSSTLKLYKITKKGELSIVM